MKNDFSITKDGRTFLNGTEIKGVLGLRLLIEAGQDPEVEIRVAISSIDVDGYTDWLSREPCMPIDTMIKAAQTAIRGIGEEEQ